MPEYSVTIDLGGTKILSALVDKENVILGKVKLETNMAKGKNKLVEDMSHSVSKLITISGVRKEEIRGITLGVPGIINPFEGFIYNAPNLGISNFDIRSEFKKYIDIPLFIENDVNLAALGIKRVEFKNQVNNMLVVFVGTGIGSALIFNGRLYRGSTFFAGEIGHLLLNQKKDRTNKSNVTFENFASRTATVKRIFDDINEGKKSLLKENTASNGKIKSRALANAVKKKDKVAVEHLSDSCKVIGITLGNLQTLLNFDTIVLGGGVIEAMGSFMMPIISEAFKNSYFDVTGDKTKIVTTKYGDDAPLYGGWELIEESESLNNK